MLDFAACCSIMKQSFTLFYLHYALSLGCCMLDPKLSSCDCPRWQMQIITFQWSCKLIGSSWPVTGRNKCASSAATHHVTVRLGIAGWGSHGEMYGGMLVGLGSLRRLIWWLLCKPHLSSVPSVAPGLPRWTQPNPAATWREEVREGVLITILAAGHKNTEQMMGATEEMVFIGWRSG